MPYNVDSFTAAIKAKGLASPNKFSVTFTKIPGGIMGGNSVEELNVMCESVSLAGRSVQSLLDRQYGLNREVAYNGPVYTPISLSFLCSGDFAEKKIFDRWNNKCVDISKGFDVAYYKDYIGEMKVQTLDVSGKYGHSVTYKECWPKTVAAIELNHSTVNTALRLTVEMQYAYWESNDIKLDSVNQTVAPRNPSTTFDKSAHMQGATMTTYTGPG
jgi:hypothetical protein